MLVQYPLCRSRYKHIPSLARQVQDLRVIRQVAAQMRRFVSSLSLSGPVAPPMHGFGCAYQMPVCQAFLRGHQMTVVADYKPNLSCIHSSLAGSCELDCYPILLRNGVKVPRIVKFCFNRPINADLSDACFHKRGSRQFEVLLHISDYATQIVTAASRTQTLLR